MANHENTQPGGKGRGTNQPPSVLTAPPKPLSLLRSLRRCVKLAVGVGLLLALVGGIGVWFGAPEPKHTVRTLLRVPNGNFLPGQGGGPLVDQNTHQRNLVALAKSRYVLNTALRDPAVAKLALVTERLEPVAWLEKEIRIDFTVGPDIMQISMQGLETAELEVLVNALRKAFLTEVVDRDRIVRKQRHDFLGDQITKLDDRLKIAKMPLKAIEGQGKGDARGRKLDWATQQHGMLRNDLLATQKQLRNARFSLTTLKARSDKLDQAKPTDLEIAEAVRKDQDIISCEQKIQALEATIAEYRRTSAQKEKHYKAVQAQEEINKLKNRIARITDDLRPQLSKQIRERSRHDVVVGMSVLEAQISQLEATEQWLAPEVERLEKAIVTLSADSKIADAFVLNDGHLEELLKRFRLEREALGVELDAPHRAAEFEEAVTQRVDAKARKMMMAGGAALGGLCLGLFGIAWLEYRARRVDSVDEVVLGLGMKLVGTVPNAPRKARGQVGKKQQPDVARQILMESVDAARTTLLHMARTHTLRSVLVTSAVAAEGKTSLSCHLAASLARAGLRTLLIDCDGRNPSVHKLFKVPCSPGFAEVLRQKSDLVAALVPCSTVSGLTLLPAGDWNEQTLLALTQGRAGELFTELQQEFDILLIDSSPVLPVADALVIGQQVDGVLLSVLCHVTRLNNLYAAAQRIEDLGIRTLGVVINGVRGSLYGSTYNYPYPRHPRTPAANPDQGASK